MGLFKRLIGRSNTKKGSDSTPDDLGIKEEQKKSSIKKKSNKYESSLGGAFNKQVDPFDEY